MRDELVEAVRDHDAILFVGAAVSRTLGLPSFTELIRDLATDLGYDPDVFEQLGDYRTLAEYYSLEKHGLGALRSRLDAAWHTPGIKVSSSELHRLIVLLRFPVIYTTNWDAWLEKAHEEAGISYRKVVSVGDLGGVPRDAVQIVKYHGDFSNDDSLVLTESSYMKRMDLASPLDIKLRSDALGKSLLFIGYSMQDPNTRLLLFRLHELWKDTPYPEARPRSFLVTSHPNPVQERVLEEWGVTSMVAPGDTEEYGLVEVLSDLARRAFGVETVT
jgi:hypothetical protein